jgi:hypothetical protein
MGFDRMVAGTLFPCKVSFDGLFIEGVRLSLDHGYGAHRAFTEAGGQPVTVLLGNEPGLASLKFYGAFGAGAHALPASVASFFIYVDYLSLDRHKDLSRVMRNGSWALCFDAVPVGTCCPSPITHHP